jgi:hypothetical protein
MTFAFAHRFEKDDIFIVESLQDGALDFAVIRDTMYMYSKRAKDAFFAKPIETYLFLRFSRSNKFNVAIEKRDKKEKLKEENDILIEIALKSLEKMAHIEGEDQ